MTTWVAHVRSLPGTMKLSQCNAINAIILQCMASWEHNFSADNCVSATSSLWLRDFHASTCYIYSHREVGTAMHLGPKQVIWEALSLDGKAEDCREAQSTCNRARLFSTTWDMIAWTLELLWRFTLPLPKRQRICLFVCLGCDGNM